MTSASDWRARTGRAWADNYALTDRALFGVTRQMLARLEALPGEIILDIGCGAGETALILAQSRPNARVTGLDISPDLIDAARIRGAGHANLRFLLADAADWQAGEDRPDLLVSRHGVMFFNDPVAAFGHLREQSLPGAQLGFSCFRDSASNIWASGLAQLLELPAPVDPHAPGPFAFADPARVQAILAAAGWQDITLEPVDFNFVTGKGFDPVADSLAFLSRIGPASVAIREMAETERSRALTRIAQWLGSFCSDDEVAMPAAAWLVVARNPA